MLSKAENERLTQVGPGTPGGNLLRRYWQAVCPVGELLGAQRKKRVRLLGEDLLVYRKDDGTFAAVQELGMHRNASLYYPFMVLPAYCIEELSGLLFIYMGPDQANPPLLPRWDVLARSDRPKFIRVMPRHACNWLQIQENTADSVHTYYLHGHMSMQLDLPTAQNGAFFYRPIESYDWSVSEWGVEKTIVYGGDRPETEIRPPLIFPNILRIPEGPNDAIHFRIPVDDEHTDIIWIGLMAPGSAEITGDRHIPYVIETDPPGLTVETVDIATFYGQDRVVWETQGRVADRSREVLGASDRGIVMFRRMLADQIDRVERGEEPTVAVVRDPAKNRCIEFESSGRAAAVTGS